MKRYSKGIFLFHRDLRVEDNIGLHAALCQCDEVLPVFIIDPRQADAEKNVFFNHRFFEILLYSVQQLHTAINVQILRGETVKMLSLLFDEYAPDAFFSNADYSAFARKRDAEIAECCAQKNIPSYFFHDLCLCPPPQAC